MSLTIRGSYVVHYAGSSLFRPFHSLLTSRVSRQLQDFHLIALFRIVDPIETAIHITTLISHSAAATLAMIYYLTRPLSKNGWNISCCTAIVEMSYSQIQITSNAAALPFNRQADDTSTHLLYSVQQLNYCQLEYVANLIQHINLMFKIKWRHH